VRRQAALHVSLLLLPALVLPLGISAQSTQAATETANPLVWLFGCLLTTAGLPFFIVSASAPLMQRWFAHTSHPSANDPYFLYSASNLGSLIALLGYPLAFEPYLRLQQQSWLWAGGYTALAVLILLCALALWRSRPASAHLASEPVPDLTVAEIDKKNQSLPISALRRLRWVMLAFVPTSLMFGVTSYLSTDLSPIPLLWVIPLAIYLLTFILVFARKPLISQGWLAAVMPGLGLILIFLMFAKTARPVWLLILLHLSFFFVAAMVCHGRLASDRPPARNLTEFYFWLSLGGVIGGLFNTLVAPLVFKTVIEYPLAISLSLLLRPARRPVPGGLRDRYLDVVWPAVIGGITAALAVGLPRLGVAPLLVVILTLSIPLLLSYALARRPVRFALAIAAVMAASSFYQGLYYGRTLHMERNFFGVLRVSLDTTNTFRQLYHGNTRHGQQFTDPARQCEPLSYFHRRGPLGQIFDAFNARPARQEVAVVGLGAGVTVCYARPEQTWTFYEINPAVVHIAREPQYFTYLQNCAPAPVTIILGDARLQLQRARAGQYRLIVLDAFSSDAIPVHLLTRQALELYLDKLASGGLLALHISNHYLDLRPVIGDLAASKNLVCLVSDDLRLTPADEQDGKDRSRWVVLARRSADLGPLVSDSRWQILAGRPQPEVWLDDYSNVLSVFRWQ
jgi:hypothetical protein